MVLFEMETPKGLNEPPMMYFVRQSKCCLADHLEKRLRVVEGQASKIYYYGTDLTGLGEFYLLTTVA